VSKSCADLIAHSYAATWGTPIVTTRCGNFFGGGDLNWSRIVPGTLRSLLAGSSPLIRSDGSLIRDYFYVEDGAIAYMKLAEALAERRSLAGQAFNFSYEEPLTVLELVARMQQRLGSTLPPTILGQASHEIPQQHLSAAKARQELGWKPEFSLDEGLDRTIAWYRTFLEEAAHD
jgi:CDP-glucose 4,6-dehydratase